MNAVVANAIGKQQATLILLKATALIGLVYLAGTYLIISYCGDFLFELFTPSSASVALSTALQDSLLPMYSYVVAFCFSTLFAQYLQSYKANTLVFKVRLYVSTTINMLALYLVIDWFADSSHILEITWYLGAGFELLAAMVLWIYCLRCKPHIATVSAEPPSLATTE